MALSRMTDRVVETDVLVIGGGIGGCPAAAKAAEHGLKVTLVEKGKTDRSGSAGQGIDGYGYVFPPRTRTPGIPLPAKEFAEIWEKWQRLFAGGGQFTDPNIVHKLYSNGFWALEELERLGVTSKWDDGEYHWAPLPEGEWQRINLRVHWQNVKPQMAAAVRKRRVNILERTMVIDLLTNNGSVVGATAVNTRTGEFIVIKAKATIIATGLFARCYNPETPLFWKYKFRYHWCPATVSGDGWAIAYRAGAELANMEITEGGSRIRDDLNISFGNFVRGQGKPAKLFTWDGEEISPHIPVAIKYAEQEQKGKTPLYLSLEHLPDDFHKRIEVAYVDERLLSFKVAEERGFNPKTHRYDVMTNSPCDFLVPPGINTDEDFKTSLRGLYAIGDCAVGLHSCGPAVVSALLVAEGIDRFVGGVGVPDIDEAQVENQKQAALAPMTVKDGTEPMELECAIRYICERYIGQFRAEGKLREGIRRLGSLRRVFLPQLMAKNPHYLMRCLEVRNMMNLVELHIQACLERNETRVGHIRLDYPDRNPSWEKMRIYQRSDAGKAVLEVREAPKLKPEYMIEEK